MARQARVAVGEVVYHVINRANGREQIFSTDAEYAHFESLLLEGVRLIGMRILAYIIMPNHLQDVIRYVEQNALRAKLVKKAEVWRWSSLYRRQRNDKDDRELLAPLPTSLPTNYLASVNELFSNESLEKVRYSITKGAPYGSDTWTNEMLEKFKMHSTQRGPGRPRAT